MMKDSAVYLNMSSHELAANESFQAFISGTSEADTLYWESFINLHPSKRRDIERAVYILSLLSFKIRVTPGALKEFELNRLLYAASLSSVQQQTSWRPQMEKTAGESVVSARNVGNEGLAGTARGESHDVLLSDWQNRNFNKLKE